MGRGVIRRTCGRLMSVGVVAVPVCIAAVVLLAAGQGVGQVDSGIDPTRSTVGRPGGGVETGFLDPFTLEVYPISAGTENVISVPDSGVSAGLTVPIVTLREWIRIPYRPPLRSPFVPGS